MYVYYPGSDIVYCAYEIYAGKLINGSSRLISALVRIMYMAFGLMIGWQTFGRGQIAYDVENPDTIIKSLLLGNTCPAFTTGYYNIEPWWLVSLVLTLVLTPVVLMEVWNSTERYADPGDHDLYHSCFKRSFQPLVY